MSARDTRTPASPLPTQPTAAVAARRRLSRLLGFALPVLTLLLAAGFLLRSSLGRPAKTRASSLPWEETRTPEETALRRAVTQRPTDAEAHRRLGEFYLQGNRPFSAIWELVAAQARQPDNRETRLRLAAALEAGQLPEMAREVLAASDAPDAATRVALAESYLRTADVEAADRALSAGSAEGSGELLVRGRILQAKGDRTAAEAAYRRYLKAAPDSVEGYYRLGRLLLEAGRHADARTVLLAGRRVSPLDPRMPFYLGLTYAGDRRASANDRRAREQFEEALRLAPGHALPQYQLGLLYARAGRWGAAADRFEAATQSDPAYADAFREMARALQALKKQPYDAYYRGLYYSKIERPGMAVREFQEVARKRPESAEGPLLVSRMLIQTMQYREASAAIEPARRRFPRDPAVYERLSVLYKLTRGRGAVEELCRQWRAALPEATEPDWVLGKLRVADGRLEEGIRLYEQALAREPERPEYQIFLGQALAQRESAAELPRALTLTAAAVSKAPRDAAARAQLGLLLQRLERPEEAREQMLRALDLDPHQPPPYTTLTGLAASLGHPPRARLFARAVRRVEARIREEEPVLRRVWQNPRDAAAHLAAARFRCATSALAKAKAHLEQAAEIRPDWPEVRQERLRVTRALEAL